MCYTPHKHLLHPYIHLYSLYTIHPLIPTYTLHIYIHIHIAIHTLHPLTIPYIHLPFPYIHLLHVYTSILVYTDRRLLMTSYNLDTSDPLLLAEYLYHEMVAMGIRLELGHCIHVYI